MIVRYFVSDRSAIYNWEDPELLNYMKTYDDTENDGRCRIQAGYRDFVYFLVPEEIKAIQQYEFEMYIDLSTNYVGQIDLNLDSDTFQSYYIYRTERLNESNIVYKLSK